MAHESNGATAGWLRRTAIVAAYALAVTLTSGPTKAEEKDWNKVIEAAKSEGTVVVYSGFVGQASTRAVADAFTAKYGIKVDILEARSPELRERLRVEQAAGRFAADIMFTAASVAPIYIEQDGIAVPAPTTPNSAKLVDKFSYDKRLAGVMTIPYGILVNTKLVPEKDRPTSWKDLTDPKWQGKILADDPRAVGGGYLWFSSTFDAFGAEFHEQMNKQKPVMSRNFVEAERRVARGEYPIYSPFILTSIHNLDGLPVEAVVPKEGVSYMVYGNLLLKNAPHPNAALLYIDFMRGPEVQRIYAEVGHGTMLDGVTEGLPENVRRLGNAPLLGTATAATLTQMIERAKQIYK